MLASGGVDILFVELKRGEGRDGSPIRDFRYRNQPRYLPMSENHFGWRDAATVFVTGLITGPEWGAGGCKEQRSI